MISAREFCREREFPVTIFLTYSFDPLFFERIPLSDLEKGGSHRTLIVADGGQVRNTMPQCLAQLAYLGRRYVLAETVSARTFHPKLIARLSPTAGRVWIGSGNLTYPGWGGHQELGATWAVGPQQQDKGLWLDPLLTEVAAAVGSSVFEDQLQSVRDLIRWLQRPATPAPESVLLGTPTRPLAPQLAERWQGRKFDELRLCTGSTDRDGAFLRWAHDTFGVRRALVCVSPGYASFDASRLKKLPLDVQFVKPKDGRMMHAKFFWFSGKQGSAAVVGSANCSAAAWLTGNGFGNFELVIPYDTPAEADFKGVLALFRGAKHAPEHVLLEPATTDDDDDHAPSPETFRIVSLRLRATGHVIEASIQPSPPAHSRVTLAIDAGRRRTTVSLSRREIGFFGRLAPEFEFGPGTAFASAHVEIDGHSAVTAPRWIDNDAALARASSGSTIEPGLRDLYRKRAMSSDQQKVLEAVYAVSQSLLRGDGDTVALSATKTKIKPDQKPEPDNENAPAVDPAAIVRTLKELKAAREAKGPMSFTPYGGSLQGVMALLFAREDDDEGEIDLSHEAWTGDNPELASDDAADIKGNLGTPDAPPPPPEAPPPESPAETAQKFRDQIDAFLWELGQPDFAEHCDAERLVQALAFPLLICVRGSEGGWLPSAVLTTVAVRVVDIMFAKSYGANHPVGLFHVVANRYARLRRKDEFDRAVGEGTLWSALLASLSNVNSVVTRSLVLQASALSQVFACNSLVSQATPEHLSSLLQSLVIPHAEFALTNKARPIAEALEQLTRALREKEQAIYARQGSGRRLHNAGSLLWSSRWSWSTTPAGQAQSYVAGYIDVDDAAQDEPAIQQRLEELRQAMLAVPAVVPAPIILLGTAEVSPATARSPAALADAQASLPASDPSLPS